MELDLTGLVLPERVEIAGLPEDGRSGQFIIEPLERGFGYTLGNPVRRVLLSGLRGAAVWGFPADGGHARLVPYDSPSRDAFVCFRIATPATVL